MSGAPFTDRHAIYFGYRRTFRRTDDFVSPRRGYLAMFEVGGSPDALATRPFVRGIAERLIVLPGAERRRPPAARPSRSGDRFEPRRYPEHLPFRTGGDTTVRGYDYLSLGVQQGDAVLPDGACW